MTATHRLAQEEAGLSTYLSQLIATGRLDRGSPAARLAGRVAEEGAEALSARELAAFCVMVLDPYGRRPCTRCGVVVPWSEMLDALDNAGVCGYCAHVDEVQGGGFRIRART